MLKSMLKGACGLAVVFSFASTSAFAEDHIVEIHNRAYMPIITYVNQGDNLIFQNESNTGHTITAPDETWTSGVIQPGSTFVLHIEEDTSSMFGGAGWRGYMMSGEFSFESAPLGDAYGG